MSERLKEKFSCFEKQKIEQARKSLSGCEYLIPVNETYRESHSFHANNPFASEVEEWYRLSTRAETAMDDMVTSMFLDHAMWDNVSNAEQNSRITHATQPNSPKASTDSADHANGTPRNRDSVWPPLNTSVIKVRDWLNSNRKRATSSNTSEWVANMNAGMTLGGATPQTILGADLLGSGIPKFSASCNAFADTTDIPLGNQSGKWKTRKGVNL